MSEDSKDPFEDKLKQSLDKSLDDLSPNVLANLNEIRHSALNQDGKARSKFQWTVWGPVGGFATAAIVAAFWLGSPATMPTHSMDELELLSAEEDLELMENIEFVAWLMEQEGDHAG